jgi:ADP-ribose pyrophosphatase YjhB (NUDIX family)
MLAKFCPQCAVSLTEKHQHGVHQVCDCGHFIGHNPIAVNVVLQPIRLADDSLGLLAGRRLIEPGLGKLSLPGGYQDAGESPRVGAVRELFEELSVVVNPKDLAFFNLAGNRSYTQIMMCWLAPELHEDALPPFVPNHEVAERVVVKNGFGMAFPSHELWSHQFLSRMPWGIPTLIGL